MLTALKSLSTSILVIASVFAFVYGQISFDGLEGLDEHAHPNVLLAGVPKGGTTDLWSLLTSSHSDFMARSREGYSTYQLEKEFNVGFISSSFISNKKSFPCPADAVQNLMKCPDKMHHNSSKCSKWLQSNSGPKFTIDANPYLMRESEQRLSAIQYLNTANDNCSWPHTTKPLIIALIRNPSTRTISYFNYFLTRQDTITLEEMLTLEMNILEKPRMKAWCQLLSTHGGSELDLGGNFTSHLAETIIATYGQLKLEMINEVKLLKQQYPKKNFDDQGILLDSIYLPQLLGLLFPRNVLGVSSALLWPMLVLQSEFLFANRTNALVNVLFPFLQHKSSPKVTLSDAHKLNLMTTSKHMNSRQGPGGYSTLSNISETMKQKLHDFYAPHNLFMSKVLMNLRAQKILFNAPAIPNVDSSWWK